MKNAAPLPSFPLTRYFILTGVITAVVVPLVFGRWANRDPRQELREEAERRAIVMARMLNERVHRDFVIPTISQRGALALEDPEQSAAFMAVMKETVAEFEVRYLCLLDLEGKILFSTKPAHQGIQLTEDSSFKKAAKGEVSTQPTRYDNPVQRQERILRFRRGGPGRRGEAERRRGPRRRPEGYSFDRRRGRRGKSRKGSWNERDPYLGSYIPIERHDGQGPREGERVGVIFINQDIAKIIPIVQSAAHEFTLYSIAGIAALMLALYLSIYKAERTIKDRTRSLIEANTRLERLSSNLEQQVAERTAQLVRSKNLASIGRLSAGVAHEVCNPIASIASCAEGLLRSLKDPKALAEEETRGEFDEYLRIIRDEAFRVKDITRSLLDFSRRSRPLRREPVDLKSVLEATTLLVAHRLKTEHKTLECIADGAPVEILGDGVSLRQMILNLTVNALDASPEGGKIRWTLSAGEDGAALLCCEDQGPGFQSDDLEHALEPFHTGKPIGQGTGLGLSIADSIARQHGGAIELANKANKDSGARITVRLASGRDEVDGAAES